MKTDSRTFFQPSKAVVELSEGVGYPMDFRAPRWDGLAVQAANIAFGRQQVTHILNNYHRAHLTLENLYDDVAEYDITYRTRVQDDPVYVAAFQSVREQFLPQVKIIPLTTGAVPHSPDTPRDKSPGLPWTRLGYKHKRDLYKDEKAMATMKSEWHLIGEGRPYRLPDVQVFARTQISTIDKNKVRATWGYPTTVFLEEARYVYPYLDFLKHRRDDYPLGYGIEMVNGGMGYVDAMFTKTPGARRCCMLDWKRFDKNIPAWLVRDCFRILKEAFVEDQVADVEGNIWNVNPALTRNRWARMTNYFINTPFLMPDGRRFRKAGGVPSGSSWTNIVDSIANAIVTRYCFYHCTGSFPLYDIYMGDDSVVMVEGEMNLDAFAEVALERFGFILNLDKSYTTTERTNVCFLGYFNQYGSPYRNQDFLIASFCFPERQDERSPTFTATRAVGQLWSTMNQEGARPWLDIIKWIEVTFELSGDWFDTYMAENPSRLKFLQIYGFRFFGEKKNIGVPNAIGPFLSRVVPASTTTRRRPVRRTTNWVDLYYRFFDDPIYEEEDIDTNEKIVTTVLERGIFQGPVT